MAFDKTLPDDEPAALDLYEQARRREETHAGQASIALALASWLALLLVVGVVALCLYGAHAVTAAWLAPLGVR